MCLGSARSSVVPLLGRTVTAGSGEAESSNLAMDDNKINTKATPNDQKKRKVTDSPNLSFEEEDFTNHFPRFVIVEAVDPAKPIRFSIFAIQKLVQCAVGTVKMAKKLMNGTVLIEVCTKVQYTNALKMTSWVDTPVKASPHRTLNSSRGVIRCRDFRDCDDEEILDALRPEGVISLKHIFSRKNGSTTPTNTYILGFNTPIPPKSVKAAYLNIAVEPFVPQPLRCYNCQRFGHGKGSCKQKPVCAKCSKEGHADSDCHELHQCVNCSGPHPSFSRECPEWARQKAIVQLKTEKNISFSEAQRLTLKQTKSNNQLSKSYSAALKPCCSIQTQTDLTWPLDQKVPTLLKSSELSFKSNETQTKTDSTSALRPAAPTSPITISNIPHYSSTPKIKIQLNNSKPGPASSKLKPVLGSKLAKGSADPIKLYNRYGSLDAMDLEVNLSPKKGPSNRKNP